jgi:L-2-hydroxyglutarate oxidase
MPRFFNGRVVSLRLGEKVIDIQLGNDKAVVVTQKSSYTGKVCVNCAGLYSDKIAKLTLKDVNVRIIPSEESIISFGKRKNTW